jgi:hypothetical protein
MIRLEREVDAMSLEDYMDTIATCSGTIFCSPIQIAVANTMIRIDKGNFADSVAHIALLSNLYIMKAIKIREPLSLRLIPDGLALFCQTWRRRPAESAREFVIQVVHEIQDALQRKGLLPTRYQVNGVVDREMIEAMTCEIPAFRTDPPFIDPKVKQFLCAKQATS